MASWTSSGARSEGAQVLGWLFEEGLKVRSDGSVGLPLFGEPNTAAAILSSRLGFDKQISVRQRYAIVRSAVIVAAKEGNTTVDGFVKIATEKEAQHLSEPLKPFVLLTSLSASDLHEMPTVRLGPATITFSRYPPKRFKMPPSLKRHRWGDRRFGQRTAVRVQVRARIAHDAADLAFRHLDLLRAFWNLGLNRGVWRITSEFHPVNAIRLGPIHTLHHADGRPALETFWYEPAFQVSEIVSPLGSEKRKRAKAEEMWCRTHIRRFEKTDLIEDIFVRYCRALDQSDQTNAFLQTWAVLEELTGNPRRYEDLVKRASYLYTNRWYVRMQLEDMRHIRNELVHNGKESDRLEDLLYRAQHFVEDYLVFFLGHWRDLQSLEDFGAFLSQPADMKDLKKRRQRLELAERVFQAV